MNNEASRRLAVGICLLLLTLTSPGRGNDATAGSAHEDLMSTETTAPTTVVTTSGSTVQSQTRSSWSCLPRYSEPETILTLYRPTDLHHMVSADFTGDGWPDVVLARALWQSDEIFELDILLNDGDGNLVLGTSEIFSGTVPSVMDARELVLADFNGDGRADIFFADEGNDSPQGTGYQNTLVLSAPGGKLVDATDNLPQQSAFTHSAAAADIDGDEDVDLYVGNLWGYTPQILLNAGGNAVFTVATGRLPFPVEDTDYGAYTTSEFVDVNNDTFPDLILGDAGDDLEGGPDSLVLLNDGTGHFSILANAIPSKPFAETDIALDIDADDINGDGYQDLFIVFTKDDPFYMGRYIQILINNQDGTFRDETPARLPQSDNDDPWIKWVYLLDLDMDGHLDIVATPLGPPGPLFYLNNGDGTFRPLPNVFNIGTDNLFTFLDIDQDGFLDVLWSWGGCQHGACPEDHFLVRALGCPVFLPLVLKNFYPSQPTPTPTQPVESVIVHLAQGDAWVPAGTPIILATRWIVDQPGLVDDYLASLDLTVTLDGEPLPGVMDYWGGVEEYGDFDGDGDTDYVSNWEYSVGVLSSGTHQVESEFYLQRPITDGFDLDEDGVPDVYSGSWEYFLQITVGE